MRLQSSLGRITRTYRTDMNMAGYMSLGKVLKVHHKQGTADVVLVNSNNLITSNADNEGKFSARILQNFANYDDERKKYWGTITPVSEGSLVLVAFMDNMKKRPVILGQFHNPETSKNVLPHDYPLYEKVPGHDRREALKHLTVYPSMGYKKVDGEGNVEFVTPSKSFLAIYSDYYDGQGDNEPINDYHLGFDHKDLSEIEAGTENVLTTDLEECKSPTNLLYVHRTDFDDEKTTWSKFFISSKGLMRMTRDNRDGKLSFLELSADGEIILRRQVDSSEHYEGENNSEIRQEINGDIVLRRSVEGKTSEVVLGEDGSIEMKHSSGSRVKLGDNLELEVDGEIISGSLSEFIERYHIVVSDKEPENPFPGLVWIDTS